MHILLTIIFRDLIHHLLLIVLILLLYHSLLLIKHVNISSPSFSPCFIQSLWWSISLSLMGFGCADWVLVKVVIRAYLVNYFDTFHLNDLSTRELVSILYWTLTNLLISDGSIDGILDCLLIVHRSKMFVSLVCILISLNWSLICSWVVDLIISDSLWAS